MKRSAGAVSKTEVALGIESVNPFSDNRRACVKRLRGRFDAM